MTKMQQEAINVMHGRKSIRGSDLGWELWGKTTDCPMRGTGSHRSNKFCRAAGKLLRGMERDGLARSFPATSCTLWSLTLRGHNLYSPNTSREAR